MDKAYSIRTGLCSAAGLPFDILRQSSGRSENIEKRLSAWIATKQMRNMPDLLDKKNT
jgi:hypothetical protein